MTIRRKPKPNRPAGALPHAGERDTANTRGFLRALASLACICLVFFSWAPFSGFASEPDDDSPTAGASEIVGSDPRHDINISETVKADFLNTCVSRFEDALKPQPGQTSKIEGLKSDSSGDSFCPKNHNGGNPGTINKVNPSERRQPLSLQVAAPRINIPRNYGHCESTVQAAKIGLLSLWKVRRENCHKTALTIQKMNECYKKNSQNDSCLNEYRNLVAELKQSMTQMDNASIEVKKYINKFTAKNISAKQQFEADKKKFEQSRLQQATAGTAPSGLPEPQRGGVSTSEEYSQLLGLDPVAVGAMAQESSIPTTSLIGEQINALEIVADLSKRIDIFKSQSQSDFMSQINRFENIISEISKKNGKDDQNSSLKNGLVNAAPLGAAGAQLLGSGGGAAAGAAAISGSAASALPALAAVGLAGAALSGASQHTASAAPIADKDSPTAPATALPGTNIAEQPGTPPGLAVTSPKAAPNSVEEKKNEGGTSTPGIFSSGGSVIGNSGRLRGPKAGSASTAASAGGASEEMLKPFSADLKPDPRPKKDDGLGDVSSLLGQMKNLFNFDEGGGAGGMPGAGGHGQEAQRDTASSDPGPDPIGDDWAGGSAQEGEYASQEEGAVEDQAQAGELGNPGVSLFTRVHKRCRISMEKGLVVNGVGGIPE